MTEGPDPRRGLSVYRHPILTGVLVCETTPTPVICAILRNTEHPHERHRLGYEAV
ncbi:MAG TPA: hypothetical protein VLB87_13495 [Pyrinomonadaceae bacterium]|nr:hypothetical protein [Pyrinomonadaceae bacterium]